MKMTTKAALAALAIPASVAIVAPAMAQAVPGIAVADIQGAAQRSNAYVAAMQSMQVTYKPQLDQAQARKTALEAEIKTMATALETAAKVPNANKATLQTQYEAIQRKEQAAQQELNRILQPYALAQAYVNEQIGAQVEGALDRAMAKKKISIVLLPDATVKSLAAAQITDDVLAEINAVLPNVQTVPPAGWRPGQQAAQPNAPQPQGR